VQRGPATNYELVGKRLQRVYAHASRRGGGAHRRGRQKVRVRGANRCLAQSNLSSLIWRYGAACPVCKAATPRRKSAPWPPARLNRRTRSLLHPPVTARVGRTARALISAVASAARALRGSFRPLFDHAKRCVCPSGDYLLAPRSLSQRRARPISTGLARWRSGMSDSASRGESVSSEVGPPASAPALSDIEAVAVASAVLALAFAILT